MVEFIENVDERTCICKSSKMVTDIHIRPSVGSYSGFSVFVERGSVPSELGGNYSNMQQAQKAVAKYLRNKKETPAARRKEVREKIAKKKEAKNGPEDRTEDS